MNAFAPPTVASVIGARFPYFKCKYKTVAFASTESNTIFFAFIFFAVFFPSRNMQTFTKVASQNASKT